MTFYIILSSFGTPFAYTNVVVNEINRVQGGYSLSRPCVEDEDSANEVVQKLKLVA